MNWQLQYVIGFVMLSTMEVDMSEEIRTKSQELLRKESVSYTHLTLPTTVIV